MAVKERYVSFEVAKLLKEKGFDGECHHGVTLNEIPDADSNIITAPTHQMACDWVLKKYGISIEPMWFCFSEIKNWDCVIVSPFIGQKWVGRIKKEDYKTKEEAINIAILYVLNNFKPRDKQRRSVNLRRQIISIMDANHADE